MADPAELSQKIVSRSAELVREMECNLIIRGFVNRATRAIMLGAVGRALMLRAAELESTPPTGPPDA